MEPYFNEAVLSNRHIKTKIVFIGHSMGGIVIKKVIISRLLEDKKTDASRRICLYNKIQSCVALQLESIAFISLQRLIEARTWLEH